MPFCFIQNGLGQAILGRSDPGDAGGPPCKGILGSMSANGSRREANGSNELLIQLATGFPRRAAGTAHRMAGETGFAERGISGRGKSCPAGLARCCALRRAGPLFLLLCLLSG